MKKIMLLTSAAALALASCSNDEVKDVNRGRAIDFRAETTSRATETNATNLQTFYASAFNASGDIYDGFDEDEYFKNEGIFVSKAHHFWPENENEELSFVAYAPAKTANGVVLINGDLELTKGGLTLKGFAPRYAIAKQIDFVHATATGTKAADQAKGVGLEFNHALSQIEINAKNSGFYKYTIAGVKIVGVHNAGDYDMTKWTTDGKTKGSYKITYDDPVVLQEEPTAKSIMGPHGTAMLLPQQLTAWDVTDKENSEGGAYIAVKLNLKDGEGKLIFPKSDDDNAYGWVAVPIATKWEAGKKYIYTLDFANGAGVVAPATGDNEFDPGKPGDEDDPDNPTDTDDDEKNPGGDEDKDPKEPGETVLDKPITFTVTVATWSETPDSPKMDI